MAMAPTVPSIDTRSDAELLEDFAQNASDLSFESLVRRHSHFVHATALRHLAGNASAAQDVSQIVFLELARQSGSLIHHPNLAGWLHRTTRWVASRLVRSESRRRHKEEWNRQDILTALECPNSDAEPDCASLAPFLAEALKCLSERERKALLLRYTDGCSWQEVGQTLGLTGNAARMRANRALVRLRRHLEHQGIVSSPSQLSAVLIQFGDAKVTPFPELIAIQTTPQPVIGFTSTSTVLTASVMKTLPYAAGLLIAGFLTSIILWQHHQLASLRRHATSLQNTIDGSRAEAATGLKPSVSPMLPDVHAELLRLRGEVTQLRKSLRQAARPEVPVSESTPTPPSSKLELHDAGTETPEATATTLMWALTQQDESRFREIIHDPGNLPPEISHRFQHILFEQQVRLHSQKQFTSVHNVRTNSSGGVRIDLGYIDPVSEDGKSLLIDLRPSPLGWKLDPGSPPPEMLETVNASNSEPQSDTNP